MQTKKSFLRVLSIVLSMVMVFAAFAVLAACPPEKLPEYTIEYNLDGGTNHADNPATYTTNDFPLTIKEPTKSGHIFEGWTSELNTDKKATLTIYLGQQKNLNLVAHWIEVGAAGTIAYRLEGGTNHAENPSVFTEDDLPLEIKAPTKDGFAFKGWTVGDSTEKNTSVTIESFEFVLLTAHWTAAEPANYGDGKKLAPEEFSLKDLDGNDVRISDFRGEKAVMISFFSHDCNNCKQQIDEVFLPNMDRFGDDFELILIHSAHEKDGANGTEKLMTVLADKKSKGLDYRKFKILLDPDFSYMAYHGYFVAGVPDNYMIDKWGYLYKEGRGASNPVNNFSHGRITSYTEMSRIVNGAISRGEGF